MFAVLATSAILAGCATPQRTTPVRRESSAAWTYDHGGIVRGDRTRKELALVFTGGDYGEGTPYTLDALKQRRVTASFFVTGDYLRQRTHRGFVARMNAEGHYVGPHSHEHLLYCAWEDRRRSLVTHDDFTRDLERNIAELRELGALRSSGPTYFIPPYEWYNEDQVRWAKEIGAVLVNYTPGTGSHRDWAPEGHAAFVPSTQLVRDILAYEAREPEGLNGFILLLHLGSLRKDKVPEHIGELLDALMQRGYQLVRIDALLSDVR